MTNTSAEFDQDALALRLKEVREYLGLSQQYVTSVTGIPRSAISEIERGNRKVDSLELRKLSRLYQVPPSYLLGIDAPDAGPTDIPVALGRVLTELTGRDYDEILRFAEFLRMRRTGKS